MPPFNLSNFWVSVEILFWKAKYFPHVLFEKVNFEKISPKYAKAYSARKYVQFHGLGSQLAVIREE